MRYMKIPNSFLVTLANLKNYNMVECDCGWASCRSCSKNAMIAEYVNHKMIANIAEELLEYRRATSAGIT